MIVSLVTTYNRPEALMRTLPGLVELDYPVLVVDDGSAESHRNASCAEAFGARYLRLPENRGLACAMNVGLEYWLADAAVRWVSYFQDDVEIIPTRAARILREHVDSVRFPLLTLHDAGEHPGEPTEYCGRPAKLKQNCRATHLHAHRDYWRAVMPIPQNRPYPTPCPLEKLPPDVQARHRQNGELRGEGSEVDHWITHRAPRSIVARGGRVLCVPGALRTFLWRKEDSCWDNQQRAGEDPPL